MKTAESWTKELAERLELDEAEIAFEIQRTCQIQADALRWAVGQIEDPKVGELTYMWLAIKKSYLLHHANQLDPKPVFRKAKDIALDPAKNLEYHCTSTHIAAKCPGCVYCQ